MKDIYITNVRFESILETFKCQIARIFRGFAPNLIGSFRSGPQIPCSKAQKLPISLERPKSDISGTYPGFEQKHVKH